MNYKSFLDINKRFWNNYFAFVNNSISQELGKTKGTLLYPVILLITEIHKCFIAELLGASNTFKELTVKGQKEVSFERYFSQFQTNDSDYAFRVSKDNTFKTICFSRTSELNELKIRFPALSMFGTTFITPSENGGALLTFDDDSDFLTIINCLFINTYLSSTRAKHVLYLNAIRKDTIAVDYEKWLKHNVFDKNTLNSSHNVQGVHHCDSEKGHDLIVASQFTNTFLTKGLHETTIGEFLKLHPEIIKKGLKTQKFIYEPYLPWLDKSDENKDLAINPDLLIERADGFYDIYDIKTALLNKAKLTKGERKRRRFIDYVEEGVAQLANYAEYFTYKKNCDYALNKYGIKVNQPNLVLIVGNFDNIRKTDIEEATRRLKNINVIDYDSFLQLFLA